MNNKVAVLLSSYNGEKYIEEQINSILSQKTEYPIILVIRDDGSSDETVNIIKNLQKRNDNIILINGVNVGYVKSFFELICYAVDNLNDCDFFSLSDQDDVWLSNKIDDAISQLLSKPSSKPQLYATTSYLVDENLENRKISAVQIKPITLYNSIIQNFSAGHSQVFNRPLLVELSKADPQKIYVHDSYITNVAVIKGSVFFDNRPHVLYRQHSQNELGATGNIFAWFSGRVNRIKRGDLKKYILQIEYIFDNYYKDMSDDERKEINNFLQCRKTIFTRLKYILSTRLYRQRKLENIVFKFAYLFGLYND